MISVKHRSLSALSRCNREERGQMLVLTALMMAVTLLFVGAAIDVGVWLQSRTKLQADVDALAISGAQELCGKVSCDTAAKSVAEGLKGANELTSADTVVISVANDCKGTPLPITTRSR